MKTQTKINIGGAALLTLILTFQIVGTANFAPNYYCEEREIQAYCYSLSSTNKTCYTQPANVGAKRCSSLWKEIPKSPIYESKQYQWLCSQDKCTPIN